MRIKIIIPNASRPFLESQVEERKRAAGAGVVLDVVGLAEGPLSVESAVDETLIGPPLLSLAKKAEEEGCDAVVIDCAMDPAVRAMRELVSIPVTSAAESALLYAFTLGERVSVITVLESTARAIEDKIRTYGFQGRVSSVRAAGVPVLDLQETERAAAAILEEARKAIDQDGADVIVLGCTGMSSVAAYLQDRLEVPVVDAAAAALTLAESLVRMKLSSSKRCYPPPPAKPVLGNWYRAQGF